MTYDRAVRLGTAWFGGKLREHDTPDIFPTKAGFWTVWQSGGGIHLILKLRNDGGLAVIGEESIATYKSVDDFNRSYEEEVATDSVRIV